MPEMKVFVINGTRYEVVDETARESIKGLAPGGYGLGVETAEKEVSDYNAAVRNGWYKVTGNASNAPWTLSSWMRVDAYNENYLVQTVYNEADGCRIAQRLKQKTWGEWEWVNPPMALGVEYRTTERYNGKVVYAKAINIGNLPNTNEATISHGLGATKVIRVGGITSNGWTIPYERKDGRKVVATATSTAIVVLTGTDVSAQTAEIHAYYTKD